MKEKMMSVLKKFKNKTDLQFGVETIEPGYAKQLLERNVNNRRLNDKRVAFYQRQIEKGQWVVNGETIKLADDGSLLDGQHRLAAIAKAGKAVESFVVRNLPQGTFSTIDSGKTRSHADYLLIDGQKGVNLAVLAAAARIVSFFDKKTGKYNPKTDKVSPTDILWFIDKHKGLKDSVQWADKMKKITSQSVAAACHYAFSLVDPEAANKFFEALATGAGLSANNPALTVRNRLMTVRADKRAGSAYQKMIVAYLVQAFNYYRAKKPLSNSVYNVTSDIILDDYAGSVR